MNKITPLAFTALTLSLLTGCGRELPPENQDLRKQSKVADALVAQQVADNKIAAGESVNNTPSITSTVSSASDTDVSTPVTQEVKVQIPDPIAKKVNQRRQGTVAKTLATQQWKMTNIDNSLISGMDKFKFTTDNKTVFTLQVFNNTTWETITGCSVDNVSLSNDGPKAVKQLKAGYTLNCGDAGMTSLIGFTKAYNNTFNR